MAFTVETGAVIAGANSLCSLESADAHHLDRGVTSWAAATEASRKSALIKATDYVEQRFSARFKGARVSDTQDLSFPRKDLVDRLGRTHVSTTVPKDVQAAVAEYALRALSASLLADQTGLTGAIKRKLEKVGSLEEETEYVTGASTSTIAQYPAADLLLAKFLSGQTGGVIR